jgi:hypothetical protein
MALQTPAASLFHNRCPNTPCALHAEESLNDLLLGAREILPHESNDALSYAFLTRDARGQLARALKIKAAIDTSHAALHHGISMGLPFRMVKHIENLGRIVKSNTNLMKSSPLPDTLPPLVSPLGQVLITAILALLHLLVITLAAVPALIAR